jgi:hypothetical protein
MDGDSVVVSAARDRERERERRSVMQGILNGLITTCRRILTRTKWERGKKVFDKETDNQIQNFRGTKPVQ